MPETVNYSLLRYQSDNIPLFDGNPKLLIRFIGAVKSLLKAFQNRTNANDPINTCLFDTILSKLTGSGINSFTNRTKYMGFS